MFVYNSKRKLCLRNYANPKLAYDILFSESGQHLKDHAGNTERLSKAAAFLSTDKAEMGGMSTQTSMNMNEQRQGKETPHRQRSLRDMGIQSRNSENIDNVQTVLRISKNNATSRPRYSMNGSASMVNPSDQYLKNFTWNPYLLPRKVSSFTGRYSFRRSLITCVFNLSTTDLFDYRLPVPMAAQKHLTVALQHL